MVGVHLTPRVDGRVLIGPNSALSLTKEGYKFWNINLKDAFLFARNKGLWKLVLGNPTIVLQEVWRDINKGAFIKEARSSGALFELQKNENADIHLQEDEFIMSIANSIDCVHVNLGNSSGIPEDRKSQDPKGVPLDSGLHPNPNTCENNAAIELIQEWQFLGNRSRMMRVIGALIPHFSRFLLMCENES
eukprot:Gb_31054 [translate_table: standard]